MPRSTALVTVLLSSAIGLGFAGCGFAPAASGNSGSGATGTPLGTGANGGGLVGGGAAQNGQGAITGMNCAEVPQVVNKLPPDILIVLDASGSMNEDSTNTSCGSGGCGATSKWALMIPAINTVVSDTQAEVNWGIKFFADSGSCGVNNNAAVGIATNNAAAIQAAIMGRTSANGGVANGSSTPTRAAEDGAVAYLRGVTDTNPKFILLATDGQPNCPTSGSMSTDDTPAAVAAVTAAAAAGFPTFVVGISAGGAPEMALNMMAVQGGYPQMGAATQYYGVTDTAGFTAVLRTLVGVAASCTFPVPTPPNDMTDRGHIGVVVNGVEIPHDTTQTNGWDYTSTGMTAIQIYGPNCNAILGGGTPDVKIVFKCIVS